MTPPRRILITNNTLASRAGSELYVRDLATGLRNRGHSPVAFSTFLGDVAEEMRLLAVPVLDDLSKLRVTPDIIHGQHHLETMTALTHFPGIPAIYVCHGWLPWEETPPLHPRILRYVAVDTTVRDRLVIEHGIPEDRVDIVLNFVDTDRFASRSPLPERPRRAIVFSNEVSEGATLDLLRNACSQRGIELDVRGTGVGASLSDPEHILQLYDLVFARGRSAIEALAVGAAVILVAPDTVGAMISMSNMQEIRARNFGLHAIQQPISLGLLLREIDRYDASDAAAVSREIRRIADMQLAVEAITSIYERVIAEFRDHPVDAEEFPAVSNYLHWIASSTKGRILGLNHTPALRSRVRKLETDLGEASNALETSRAEARSFQREAEEAVTRLRAIQAELEASHAQVREAGRTLSEFDAAKAGLGAEIARLADELENEREQTAALRAEQLELHRAVADLTSSVERAKAEKRDWERTLSARIVGLIRQKLW